MTTKRLCTALALTVLLMCLLAGCTGRGGAKKTVPADVPQETQTVQPQVTPSPLTAYVGVWEIDGQRTGAELAEDESIYDLFGSGLRTYGARLTILPEGKIAYHIGEGIFAKGSCRVQGETLVANVQEANGEDAVETEKTLRLIEEKGLQYLQTDALAHRIYWVKTRTILPDAEEIARWDRRAEESYRIVTEYGKDISGDYSVLSYDLDGATVVDCGAYYALNATFAKPVEVPDDLKKGQACEVVINELTGEKETLEMTGGDTLISRKDGTEYRMLSGAGGKCILVYDSDDRLDAPFYEGVLRIRKDALTGVQIMRQYEPVTLERLSGENLWFNGVIFDEDGFVTRLVYIGD